jgi:hypothetical protein
MSHSFIPTTSDESTAPWLRFNWLLQTAIFLIGLLIVLSISDGLGKQASWVKLNVTQPAKWDLYLTVAVGDNGCGKHSEDMKKIFQPLFSIKAASRGTGVDLYKGANPVDSS